MAQGLAIWNARQLEKERRALSRSLESERQSFQISQAKLAVLRKFAGNRAAVSTPSLPEHRTAFYEALNEIMIAFSGSAEVVKALDDFRTTSDPKHKNDRLITLFKAMCRDVGVDLSAFNDTLFMSPFGPGAGA